MSHMKYKKYDSELDPQDRQVQPSRRRRHELYDDICQLFIMLSFLVFPLLIISMTISAATFSEVWGFISLCLMCSSIISASIAMIFLHLSERAWYDWQFGSGKI
jgi:hypothetical protein